MSLHMGAGAAAGVALWAALCAAEPRLAAHYPLDEGSGVVAVDKSGNGNDGKILGKASWAKGSFGTALDLDGSDAYVACGWLKGLDLSSGGTIAAWCRPRSLQGGVVGWFAGESWTDCRLILAFNTYSGGDALIASMATPKRFQTLHGFGELEPGAWVHLAIVFDGKSVKLYRNGLVCNSEPQQLTPDIKGLPPWIGRCEGLGKPFFDGLIDEVRIYSGPLSAEEVAGLYTQDAARRGKGGASLSPLKIEAAAYPGPGRIIASVEVRSVQPLATQDTLTVELCNPGAATPLQRQQLPATNFCRAGGLSFDVQELPAGEYTARCALTNSDGKPIGEAAETKVNWPGQPPAFKGVHVLNNLAWELLNARAEPGRDLGPALSFNNPWDRWVFIRATADAANGGRLSISVDSQDAPALLWAEGSEAAQEAMQFLPAGPHALHVKSEGGARLREIVVRSIPMLQYAFYNAQPYITAYGPYDWAFLKKDVLPNINVMMSGEVQDPPELKAWKQSGRKWITCIGVPEVKGTDAAAVDAACQHWAAAAGYSNPLMDGIIVDELGGDDKPVFEVYRQAVERLYANPQFKGKMFIPYVYDSNWKRGFAKAVLAGNGYAAWECYLRAEPSASAARVAVESLADRVGHWEKEFPGITRRLVLTYGCMTQPNETLNVNPSVDYRVFMDMQIQELATNPVYFGLAGIQEYHASYCDEENLRLTGRLYRHYAIEGNTAPLIADPYGLTHIRNPDFDKGTEGWTITPAEKGCIERRSASLSWLEGRYPQTDMGDTFLWMKRSASGPSSFSQEIKDLVPGRLYSLKMISADYQDLIQQRSVQGADAVTIQLDNVEILSGPKNSFQCPFFSNYGHTQGKFKREYPFYMNYHWRVFRAKEATSRLTVSDWAGEKEPGGPIGQELLFNFIQIEPYIGE